MGSVQNGPFSPNSSRKKNLLLVCVVCVLEEAFQSDDMQGSGSVVGTTATAVVLHLIIWLKTFPDSGGCAEAPPSRKPQDFSESQVRMQVAAVET